MVNSTLEVWEDWHRASGLTTVLLRGGLQELTKFGLWHAQLGNTIVGK